MIKKQFFKSKCKVTFEMPKGTAEKSVAVVGDFNDWDQTAAPMKQLKSGVWKTTIDLQKDDSYQFRYVVDGDSWINDGDADSYVTNDTGDENCVVETTSV